MPSTYEPIATTTLSTSAADVTFSSISQAYTDLILVSSQFYVSSGSDRAAYFQVGNGTVDTGSNYSFTYLDTYTGSPNSGRSSSVTSGLHSYTQSIPTSQALICTMQLLNYSNTTTYKTTLHRPNAASGMVAAYVNLWRSTAAINVIKIISNGANFASGSTFTLYGIKAA